ncbi:sigma-54 dependent transcriptional regulator [Sphingomonas sp. QA11]|uniref:sigma-54-dependent transcriptional regulator n=1 Tax=Sphingomonas sp. QA11 TaxID=2950605 RepID=UPI00234A1FC0|nr:sigma-54 dependent transcriptional regulator [Sphingomonas sp. QA11]WCM25829.1 sigma-54 dependent transcriptional regulator [Sphingomonas sp. QA11]
MLFPTEQNIFFVEDDAVLRAATIQTLELAGLSVRPFASATDALPEIRPDFAGIIISDIRMPGIDGLQLLERVRAIDPDIPVILITGHADVAMAVGALRDGAFDFLTKPFATDHLVAAAQKALEKRLLVIDNRRLRAAAAAVDETGPLIGDSPAMVQLRGTIRQLALADIDVLVEGETGTGKELAALLLHRLGARRGRPFIAVNCGALPETLAEVELFGHAADSVPHTRLARIGQIEASSGGTLLLDEIDSMALPLQARLLRVLEEREVQPIGDTRPRGVDLRVIATTKTDLARAATEGRFRPDLYYRLTLVRLRVPPLRERGEDIATLFASFVEEAKQQAGIADFLLTDNVRGHLRAHDWPGNVRELRNFAFGAVLGLAEPPPAGPAGARPSLPARVNQFEAGAIEEALRATGGSVAAALPLLGIPRKTFYDKVARLGIRIEDFRPRSAGAPSMRKPTG